MREIDQPAVDFWATWWTKWQRRIACLSTTDRQRRAVGRRPRRVIRSTDVWSAWLRMFMPAMDPAYVMPEEWLALSPEEQRTAPRPTLRFQPRRVSPASERGPGWSMDDVGPYLKLPDGTVFRDRASAARRLWRQARVAPAYRAVIDFLPKRAGQGGRPVRARTAERMLDALVAFGLVRAGMTRVAAATAVLAWANTEGRNSKKVADENSRIWQELHLPAVRE